MVCQGVPEAQQPVRITGGDERAVEPAVLQSPTQSQRCGPGRIGQGRARQHVHGRHDFGLPRRGSVLDRGGEAQALDAAAGGHQVGERRD